MNKYILELLRLQKTVILPGFGALSVVNEEKNDIMFMPYLKHDDGKLTEYISENSNMDEAEAKNSIAKFIREIELELNKGESYNIFQFGEFHKNEDGEIEFEAWKGKKEVISDNVGKNDNEVPSFDGDGGNEENKFILEVEPKVVPIAKPVEQPIDKKEELDKNQAKLDALKNQPKEKKKKRGAGFWIVATLLLLIGAGSTFFALNYDQYKEYVPFLASKNVEEVEKENEPSELEKMQEMMGDDSSEDSILEEETVIEENSEEPVNEPTEEVVEEIIEEPQPVKEEVSTPTPVVSSSGKGNYHAIIGAFSNINNANRLCEELKSEGFPAHVFKNGSLNPVSIQSFETSQEANAKLSELRERSSGIWIMKKKL